MKSRHLILAACLLPSLVSCESRKVETIGPESQPTFGPSVALVGPLEGDTLRSLTGLDGFLGKEVGVDPSDAAWDDADAPIQN